MQHTNSNPEKEPTPERKWWSVFERQTEYEDEADTKKRTERAKQLKSAAKKRGHFWESLLPAKHDQAEQGEVAPQGEKVRKKWRAMLRRKSEKQVEEFKQEDPETIDGYWLAQLIVAERIIVLHEQLPQSEPKTNERRQIKTELDALGLLSEKLSDPSIEVPIEIETTFQTIITVLEQGDHDIPTGELLVIEHPPLKKLQETELTREQSFQKTGGAVVTALKKILQNRQPKPAVSPLQHSIKTQTPDVITTSPTSRAPTAGGSPTEQTPTPRPTLRMIPSVFLTNSVVIAEYSDRKDESRSQEPISLSKSQTIVALTGELAALPGKKTPVVPPSEANTTRHSEVEDNQTITAAVAPKGPDRKFEYMRTGELLQLARSVSLGSGENLSHAYQSGKIDREGLIKVLKTASRQGNYREEFWRRSAEYTRHISQDQPVNPIPTTTQAVPERTPAESSEHESAPPVASSTPSQPSAAPQRSAPLVATKPIFTVKTITLLAILITALILLVVL